VPSIHSAASIFSGRLAGRVGPPHPMH